MKFQVHNTVVGQHSLGSWLLFENKICLNFVCFDRFAKQESLRD